MINRLKISLVSLPVVIVLLAGIYVYSLWAAERRRAADAPADATGMMVRDLLAYHKKRGGFPNDLKRLEGVVWEDKRSREFSIGNRGLIHRNYFYLYTRLGPHGFTVWAVPVGPSRDDGATFFIAGTPRGNRTWKGAALTSEIVRSISANPSEIELSSLGLVEQPGAAPQRRSK